MSDMPTWKYRVVTLTLLLLAAKVVVANGNENFDANDVGPCTDVTCATVPTSHPFELEPAPTERPKKNTRVDPDKYGLVPPFLIGASLIILIYIVSHCIYLNCHAKNQKRAPVGARGGPSATGNDCGGQTNSSVVLTDLEQTSTTSLAVRYDGASGRAEIVPGAPHAGGQGGDVGGVPSAIYSDVVTRAAATRGVEKNAGGGGGGYKFKTRVSANSYSGSVDVQLEEPTSGGLLHSVEDKGEHCPGKTQGLGGLRYHVLVDATQSVCSFSPMERGVNEFNHTEDVIQYGAQDDCRGPVLDAILSVYPQSGSGQITSLYTAGLGDSLMDEPLLGNASNMAVPVIIEENVSETDSLCEMEVLVHGDITILPRLVEHAV